MVIQGQVPVPLEPVPRPADDAAVGTAEGDGGLAPERRVAGALVLRGHGADGDRGSHEKKPPVASILAHVAEQPPAAPRRLAMLWRGGRGKADLLCDARFWDRIPAPILQAR